jgi:hypothetical protein
MEAVAILGTGCTKYNQELLMYCADWYDACTNHAAEEHDTISMWK